MSVQSTHVQTTSKGELEDKQKRGHTLNANQLNKLKQKQQLQHKLDDITHGTFAYKHVQNPAQNHHNPNKTKHAMHTNPQRMKPISKQQPQSQGHALDIKPLKRHHIKRMIALPDAASTVGLDVNEKFERLLSRPTYSIWAVRELFGSLNDDEWRQLPTEYIRHVLDSYYARNDLIFVHKILMKWFPHKMGHRFVLYNDLCRAQMDANNLKQSLEVFEYLLYTLMVTAKGNQEDIASLLYIIYDIIKILIPKLIQLGQFHVFDTLVTKLMELKEDGFIAKEAVHGVFSNANLVLLFETCVDNESLHRLLVVTQWIIAQQEGIEAFIARLNHEYLIRALVLAINAHNNELFVAIIELCKHGIDARDIRFEDTVMYCVEHRLLHCILNEDTHWSLAQIIDLHHVELNDIKYFGEIHATYCRANLTQNNKLGIASWHIVCEWLGKVVNDECGSIINDFVHYFAVNECFESLSLENMGDAMRWNDLIHSLLSLVNGNCDRMNGIICGLQMMAYLKYFDGLSRIINQLPNGLMETHCRDVIECCVCDDIHSLFVDAEEGIFVHRDDACDDDIKYIKRAFEMIQVLDEIRTVHNITNTGWCEGEKKFRHKLQERLQQIDGENVHNMNVNAVDVVKDDSTIQTQLQLLQHHSHKAHHKKDNKQHELKWFDALSKFAFE